MATVRMNLPVLLLAFSTAITIAGWPCATSEPPVSRSSAAAGGLTRGSLQPLPPLPLQQQNGGLHPQTGIHNLEPWSWSRPCQVKKQLQWPTISLTSAYPRKVSEALLDLQLHTHRPNHCGNSDSFTKCMIQTTRALHPVGCRALD